MKRVSFLIIIGITNMLSVSFNAIMIPKVCS